MSGHHMRVGVDAVTLWLADAIHASHGDAHAMVRRALMTGHLACGPDGTVDDTVAWAWIGLQRAARIDAIVDAVRAASSDNPGSDVHAYYRAHENTWLSLDDAGAVLEAVVAGVRGRHVAAAAVRDDRLGPVVYDRARCMVAHNGVVAWARDYALRCGAYAPKGADPTWLGIDEALAVAASIAPHVDTEVLRESFDAVRPWRGRYDGEIEVRVDAWRAEVVCADAAADAWYAQLEAEGRVLLRIEDAHLGLADSSTDGGA